MNEIHITYTEYPDGGVSGLDASGLTVSQLRYYALDAGFGVVGDPNISTVFVGSRSHVERLFLILEVAGYEVSEEAFEFDDAELAS